MSIWTLRQQRRYDPHGNGPQNHSAARRAVRQVKRHAWEFHGAGAGADDAVRHLAPMADGLRRMNLSMENMRTGLGEMLKALRETDS